MSGLMSAQLYRNQMRAIKSAERLELGAFDDDVRKRRAEIKDKYSSERRVLDDRRLNSIRDNRQTSSMTNLAHALLYDKNGNPYDKNTSRTFSRGMIVDLAMRHRLPQSVIEEQIVAYGGTVADNHHAGWNDRNVGRPTPDHDVLAKYFPDRPKE